ncbi:unnamed protein product [Owenia fusiformis]|uniref:3-hydroxy-3-methylglutaryl coenzyme A reductase n=1 Tax=Owenia fusiformis TaxID=6347 RepID=A0A8J1XRX4_OWEFU|nr:unnamed protein product [Owenia fusiformis]
MLKWAFMTHGEVCASHPWEVIMGMVTLATVGMSFGLIPGDNDHDDRLCGLNFVCSQGKYTPETDLIILPTITRCVAVIYFYLQFRNLKKTGSKYLLGIIGVFTILSSFVFSFAVVKIMGKDVNGLNEALPFFLLLVDVSRACSLARYALRSRTQEEVRKNIGYGMADIGPIITLDSCVEFLVIGVGTISGVPILQTMSCFGCLSVIVNYIAFMTFYPACLALVLEILREVNDGQPIWQIGQVSALKDDGEKPDPVTQRIKMIMSAGLVLVYARSWSEVTSTKNYTMKNDTAKPIFEQETEWHFYLLGFAKLDRYYMITAILGIVLLLKYLLWDRDFHEIDNTTELVAKDVIIKDEPTFKPTKVNQELRCSNNSNGFSIIVGDSDEDSSEEIDTHNSDCQDTKSSNNMDTLCDNGSDTLSANCVTHSLSTTSSIATSGNQIAVPTDEHPPSNCKVGGPAVSHTMRTVEECKLILSEPDGPSKLTDEEVLSLVNIKHIPAYKLESSLGDPKRGVAIRRKLIQAKLISANPFKSLPYSGYQHYDLVSGACCENVVGYMPVPVGVAGPLLLDDKQYQVPLATTEGALVASTNRGCRALALSGGVTSSLLGNGMTRAPVIRFLSAKMASEAKSWLEKTENFQRLQESFNSTSNFATLQRLQVTQAGRLLFVRIIALTGDAMGMNMISKGAEKALNVLHDYFPDMEVLGLSGNYCTDKKPAAINWIEGRGKSIVCEATIPAEVVTNVLKTSTDKLVELNISKNLIGSAMAGSMGGFNAHAANVVTAMFIATGQDPAQNIASSNCITLLERTGENNEDLYISCTMPSIEVGTIGGGTVLPPQASCLELLGVQGPNKTSPGENATQLARIVCATVLAGELSLMAALAAGHLVKSHLRHNRSQQNITISANSSSSSISEGTENSNNSKREFKQRHKRSRSTSSSDPDHCTPS